MKKTICAVLCCLLLISSLGCGSSAEKALVGEWRSISIENGESAGDDYSSALAASMVAGGMAGVRMTFEKDGTGSTAMILFGSEAEAATFRYSVSGGKIVMDFDDDSRADNEIEYSLDGDLLTLKNDGTKIVLKKQN